jgi:hypothetical protein
MDISFADSDSDSIIMRRDLGGASSGSIRNYSTSSSMVEPSYGFSFASTSAVFGYTVTASNTNHIDDSFLNDGTYCNQGSGADVNVCWMRPTTTTFRITDVSEAVPSGSTTTVRFRVYIPNSPSPAVDSGFYTATATLSAFTQ